MIQAALKLPHHPGLVDVLAGTARLADAIQLKSEYNLFVLAAGPVPSNPNELIGSETMLETIRSLEDDYDLVIIDTPPVLPVADALHLGVNVSGVVIVTRLGETTRDRLRRTKEALDNVHANLIGVVPNGAVQREDSAYAYAYRYRSKRKAPDIPYAPREPEIEPHPSNLRPAERGGHEATEMNGASKERSSRMSSRKAKHAQTRGGRRSSDESIIPVDDDQEQANDVSATRLIGSSTSPTDEDSANSPHEGPV
jgi:capsular exopolysaccharide synthesis family protein